MIAAIVLASLSAMVSGQAAAGLATCLCITEMPPAVTRVDCSYEWGVDGICFQPTGLASNFTFYPGDYGLSCKAHKEPGHSACTDLTTVPPTEKPQSEQADWCYAHGATLTHVTAMHLMQQRATTSLIHCSTVPPHVVPRTHTPQWRAQPIPLEMQNVQHKMRAAVTPTS